MLTTNHLKDFRQQTDKVRMTLRLPLTMDQALSKLAASEGRTVSDVVREIINDDLRGRE
jgi:predicted DNA-binding protein